MHDLSVIYYCCIPLRSTLFLEWTKFIASIQNSPKYKAQDIRKIQLKKKKKKHGTKYEHKASLVVCVLVLAQKIIAIMCPIILSNVGIIIFVSVVYKNCEACQKAEITVLMLLMWQLYLFIRDHHLPLRLPNALPTVIRALLRRLEASCVGVVSWFSGCGFISRGSSRYAASLSITTGTFALSNLSEILGNSVPRSHKDELVNNLTSWTHIDV